MPAAGRGLPAPGIPIPRFSIAYFPDSSFPAANFPAARFPFPSWVLPATSRQPAIQLIQTVAAPELLIIDKQGG